MKRSLLGNVLSNLELPSRQGPGSIASQQATSLGRQAPVAAALKMSGFVKTLVEQYAQIEVQELERYTETS